MAEKSPGKEFLEIAIEIERSGYKLYELAADQKSKEVRDILLQLAGREREHEHTFRDMLTRVDGYIPENPCENYDYIRSVADSNVFVGERIWKLLTQKAMTDIEVLEAGIGFEKDSILFYSEIRGMLPKLSQNIIDMIVNEEKKHLSELTYLVNKIRSG